MKVTLNTDKHPFYSIGKVLLLTLNEPGPVDIDLLHFSPEEIKQLHYGINTGALLSDEQIPVPVYTTPHQLPITEVQIPEEVSFDSKLDSEIKSLKKVLVGHVSTVKKQLTTVKTIRQLKKLLSLEQENLSRPVILKTIQLLLDKHTEQVTKITGTEEIPSVIELTKNNLVEGSRGLVNLANLTDVVESDETPISIKYEGYKEE